MKSEQYGNHGPGAPSIAATLAVDGSDERAGLSTRGRLKAILAGSLGNLIEWYDYYVYAFTALYFASSFFPSGDRTAQLLATAGIFAVGFFVRPLGGWYFGHLADRRGRRFSMVASIVMMGFGSLLLAVLPTYSQVGVLAPILLLVGRMIQGFSTGGQYGTVATYLSEVAPPTRRGFFASFQLVTLICGQLAALLVILTLQTVLDDEQMQAFGWRIAFLIGAIFAIAFLFLRHMIHETSETGEKHPDTGMIRGLFPYWRGSLTVLGLTAGGTLMFYTFTTYMQKFLVNTAHMEASTVNVVMTLVLIPFIILQPALGRLSDKVGCRTNMRIFSLLATLVTVPLLGALSGVESPVAAFGLVLCGLVVISFYTSISGLFKAELFPLHVRALGVSLAYGVGNALFGGTAEFIALYCKQMGYESLFYWYVSVICCLSLVTALLMRDTRVGNALDDVKL